MNTNFPKLTAFPVLATLADDFSKAEIYLVGGAVRDILLGRRVTDIDFVVAKVTGEQLEDFLATRGRVVFAGKNFGVWKFHEIGKPRDEIYDIALPRTEFSLHKQGVYTDFAVKTNPNLPIEDDLTRRDFSVNAMAYDLRNGRLLDPTGGENDLENKIIRTVGNSQERFQEDYSRLLRALRFSLQLNFTVEPETKKIIRQMLPNINNEIDGRRVVPYEVISEEFIKSLAANAPAALDLWDEMGALAEFIPELLQMKGCPQPENWHAEGDAWQHTRLALAKLNSPEFKKEFGESAVNNELLLTVLFHDIGKPYTVKTPAKDGIDRIRFDEHDRIGAELAKKIMERVKMAAPPPAGINADNVYWCVHHHLVAIHGRPETMRPTTIEKYFFNPNRPSQNLLKLMLADGLATVNAEGKPTIDHFEKICERLAQIKKTTGSHGAKLVKPLVSGEDVMAALGIPPGKKVGEILEQIRHKQLSGELKSKKDTLDYLDELKQYASFHESRRQR